MTENEIFLTVKCEPVSYFSWDYRLECDGKIVDVQYDWLCEEGRIKFNDEVFEVVKPDFSGFWILKKDEIRLAEAKKPDFFTRTYEIKTGDNNWLLEAESIMGSSFRLSDRGNMLARVTPVDSLSLSAKLEYCSLKMDLIQASFIFWLVGIAWRRASSD